ncbi:apolipoprotein N-acyltransferase [Allobranchiibius sp. CTAmp26]|uniref:apolipoprotein N-acyltransferase n=1 Tax=Allobranchiibius sp. CTAmp26 TaxID=2815214 RepID=UPI001AA19616|nr:apolipoprotein N-acyltransferase [Allobranchiibius sp. CTAmp26]MBO1754658.1 apolipoprotein N-acyltransferase [Allobranchiibius sp. CTAmp26]
MWRRLLLCVVGGLCLWLSFPSLSIWPLAIVGVALISLGTCGARARVGFLCGLVGGAACFLPVLHWTGIYVGPLPWIALGITESIYVGFLGLGIAILQSAAPLPWLPRWLWPAAGPRVRPFWVALLWVVQEGVRSSVPFGGFPWARLAWSQSDSPLAHLASIAGAPGLTFVVALLGGVLAAVVHRWAPGIVGGRQADAPAYAPRRSLRPLWPVLAVVAVVAASVWYPTPTSGKKLQVVGIQGNVPTIGLEFNAQRRAVLDDHARTTARAAAMVARGQIPAPDLVVWPENSSDIDPTRNPDAMTEILHAVAEVKAPLIVGAVLDEPAPDVSNASLLYLPGEGIVARYVKQHPVPFAEYMPYRSFFRHFSSKVDLLTVNFTHGKKTGLFTIPTRTQGDVKVGPVICFEVAYDGLVRAPVEKGAQLIIVQTNNATFGRTAESEQQLAISRIRAIEHGRSVVHVSTVGVSGLITPDGVVHDRSSLFTSKVLSGAMPLRSSLTLADRLGNLPEHLAYVLAVASFLLAASGSRRRRTAVRADTTTPRGRQLV